MISNKKIGWILFCILGTSLMMTACRPSLGPDSERAPVATPTPTPTTIPGGVPDMPESASRCEGLSGVLELQLLVGPSEAVGLEPHAIGEIEFSIVSTEGSNTIEGANTISYKDVLAEEWGTYTVSFDMDITLGGVCTGEEGAEQLMVDVTMSGTQIVEVEADGFQGEYPWSGTHENALVFPLQEGATAEGDGWQLVLHINQ